MCCVFTCCGWMIDLLQRLWTFTMSCCISSAVCCALLTASMSGIAMGYNYSLAEYIDLKETNVSVYLKRGVFDDDVADDMDWRRRGHMPVSGHIRDSNLVTEQSDDESMPVRSGRRLDDSMLQSDDHQRFEGSLMQLTAKAPDSTPSAKRRASDEKLDEVVQKYPSDSLDQLKAIHSLMNMRKANDNRATKLYDKATTQEDNFVMLPGGRRVKYEPDTPNKLHTLVNGRPIPINPADFKENPIRLAVPDPSIGEAANWFLPRAMPKEYERTLYPVDYDNVPNTKYTYPSPIRYRTDVQRPTRVNLPEGPTSSPIRKFKEEAGVKELDTRRLEKSELRRVQNNLLMDKANFPSFRKANYEKSQNSDTSIDEGDYEEEAKKGLPVRKKRNLAIAAKPPSVQNTSYKDYASTTILNILYNDKKINANKMEEVSVVEANIIANNSTSTSTKSTDVTAQSRTNFDVNNTTDCNHGNFSDNIVKLSTNIDKRNSSILVKIVNALKI